MTTELNIQDYSDALEFGRDLRREFYNKHVSEVRVRCGNKFHYATLENLDGVCVGLRIAAAFDEVNVADAQQLEVNPAWLNASHEYRDGVFYQRAGDFPNKN